MKQDDAEKRTFFVVYDYGTGGVWMIFKARSKEEINQTYPELKVVDERPSWMNHEHYERIAKRIYDIDEPPTGWLKFYVDHQAN